MNDNCISFAWPGIDGTAIYQKLIEELPQPLALFVGNNMVMQLANEAMLYALNKDASVLGLPFRQAMPELEGQPFFQLLDDVFTSGIAYESKASLVQLVRNGILQTFYFDFCYKPLKNEDGQVWGILNTGTDVTALVLARQEAVAIEERLTLALNSAEVGVWDQDLIRYILTWDDRCKQLFGFAPGNEVCFDNMLINVHDEDKDRVNEEMAKSKTTLGSGIYDSIFRIFYPADKRVHWLHCKGRAYFNEEDVAERFSGTALDVTLEMEARIEQQKLLTLVENSSDYMGITDAQHKKIYLNKAGRQLIGLGEKENVSKHTVADFYASGEQAGSGAQAVFDGTPYPGKVFLRHLTTGEIIPCQASYVPIYDPITGKPAGRGAALRDLRPELAAQKAIAESEQLFRNITSAAPSALWMTDDAGSITYTNRMWQHWTGQPAAMSLGTGWMNCLLPEDRDKAVEKFVTDFTSRQFHDNIFRITDTAGKVRWVACTGNPQYNSEGIFNGYIGACVDITEQQQLQQQKDNFIGIASHELKTPVTSIKAYGQVLEAMFQKSGNEKAAGMLQKMDAQINRLTSLIGDLLDVTKINSGRLQFNNTYFDFNEMMHTLIDDLQHTTNKHTIIKQFHYTGQVFSDRDRIGQVLINLVTNAIKYSPHSDTIIVTTQLQEGNEIQVCVKDFGVGIAPEKQSQVFEQFYRVSGNLQHTFPGLGLGLYISSEIIKREGGRIWVNSQEGKGSTFCFALPANNTPVSG